MTERECDICGSLNGRVSRTGGWPICSARIGPHWVELRYHHSSHRRDDHDDEPRISSVGVALCDACTRGLEEALNITIRARRRHLGRHQEDSDA